MSRTPERLDAFPTHHIAGFGVRAGRPLPFGASRVPGGVNFSVYSAGATGMTLVLYRRDAAEPLAELDFPPEFVTGAVYSMTVFGIDAEAIEYGYRADGPFEPEAGHRFDRQQVLLDPYATLLHGRDSWGGPRRPLRSGVALDDFDWEDDRQLRLPSQDLVIYETHVRGFTRHPSAKVREPGTFAGLVEKIPYLKELGVNAIELMPVFEFDELDNERFDPDRGEQLRNYWGYSTVGFFAPKAGLAATGRLGMQADEFKNMVKQLHRAGIEVILDVVFNHTAEGNELGPTLSFRGLDNSVYYMLTPDGYYYNFSGTGNTLNCNHPVVRGFVLDCLRHWASQFHVDGFRFDLAAILGRAPNGAPLPNPPLLESLAADPILRDCKLIAEAWDAGGLYQVGSFPNYHRFSEWNGKFRDTVRRFVKGDEGVAGELATRLLGSPDLYAGRAPTASVNFVTAHDGFTLHDLVAYNGKHNDANGEGNRDGDNDNASWNCGAEGDTDDPQVLALRARQLRNMLLLLLTSHGIPMMVAGDEFARTQRGNNNAYCQDNDLSWVDWRLAEANAGLLRFTRAAIAFRKAHPALRRPSHPRGHQGSGWFPEVSWHGERAWTPDWSSGRRLVAAMFYEHGTDEHGQHGHDCVYLAANAHWDGRELELPGLPDGVAWHLFADTAQPEGEDVHQPGDEPPLTGDRIWVEPRSTVVLVAKQTDVEE